MNSPLKFRRHLVQFSSHNLPHMFTDVLVIGTGIAGLSAALEAAKTAKVTLLCKDKPYETNTCYAQGGIAAAIAPWDNVEEHIQDTLSAGQGLCDEEIVRFTINNGAELVKRLIEGGAEFDKDDGKLAFGKEGGHGKRRILHANGDATGAMLQQFLLDSVFSLQNVNVLDNVFVLDILDANGVCDGVIAHHRERGRFIIRAAQTILATGGCGCLFRETTNPDVATGDGLAMAWRAGVELMDLEFVQFHPTTLYVAGATRTLISEAVRGEGAILLNGNGERFMPRYHPDAELAPRDVVSRAIVQELASTQSTHVFLDLHHLPAKRIRKRFPGLCHLCESFGIDMTSDQVPVRPAAHYMVGGVRTDSSARTSMDGLYACGEIACTGFHGANRLGSNSLLEGLVFGHVAGANAAKAVTVEKGEMFLHSIQEAGLRRRYGQLNLDDVRVSLRSLLWRNVGVMRHQRQLDQAEDMIDFWCHYVMDKEFDSKDGWELQNMLTVSKLLVMCARQREETRGVHHRIDFPEMRPDWQRRIVLRNSSAG